MRWIPPFGLIAGHVAHGASWLILFWVGLRAEVGLGPATLAWIHVVALAWFSVISLSILVHVIPAFTRTKWRDPLAVRGVLLVAILGSLTIVIAFARFDVILAAIAGAFVVAAAFAYIVFASRCVRPALAEGPRPRRFVAVGFLVGLGAFALTALLGTLIAFALGGALGPGLLARVPAVHAHLGLLLWLTTLIFGVSVRTFNPIFGAPPNDVAPHRRISAPFTLGALVAIVGLAVGSTAVVAIGIVIAAVGTFSFAAHTLATLRRATVAHRVPQAFILASAIWLVVATIFGFLAALGRPLTSAYLYVGLIGWIGMMVIGHMHHIGVRLLLTVRLGEDDETRPHEVLVPALGWFAFAVFQVAVLIGIAGVPEAAATFGFLGWLAMTLNAVSAWSKASERVDSRSFDLIRSEN